MKRILPIALLLAACGSPIDHLPQHEQDKVGDCLPMVRSKSCADTLEMATNICVRNFIKRHGRIKNRDGREAHLIDMGCPKGMVRGSY